MPRVVVSSSTTTLTASTTGAVVHDQSPRSSVIPAWNSSSRGPVGLVSTVSTTPCDVARAAIVATLLSVQSPVEEQDALGRRYLGAGAGEHVDTIPGLHRESARTIATGTPVDRSARKRTMARSPSADVSIR